MIRCDGREQGDNFEPAIYQDEKEIIHQFEVIILPQKRKRIPTYQQESLTYCIISPGMTNLNCLS